MEQMQLDSEAMAKDEVGTLGVYTSVSDAGQLKQASQRAASRTT